jgi:hypothetical protein
LIVCTVSTARSAQRCNKHHAPLQAPPHLECHRLPRRLERCSAHVPAQVGYLRAKPYLEYSPQRRVGVYLVTKRYSGRGRCRQRRTLARRIRTQKRPCRAPTRESKARTLRRAHTSRHSTAHAPASGESRRRMRGSPRAARGHTAAVSPEARSLAGSPPAHARPAQNAPTAPHEERASFGARCKTKKGAHRM